VRLQQRKSHGGWPADGPRDRASVRSLHMVACALLVLIVGVAGSASAAVLIGSKQVKDGSLTGRDLRLGTVRGSDVRDDSVKPQDFGVIPKGPTGPQGDRGDRGSNGSPGLTVVARTPTVPARSTMTIGVPCTPPQRAIFGASSFVAASLVDTMQSAPEVDGSQWVFEIRNRSSVDQTVTLQAYCVTDR